MTAPPFRAVDQHTGEVAPGVDQSMLTGFADVDRLQAELAKSRADAAELRDLLAAANRHNAGLSATLDRYGLEILDLTDSCAEQAVRVQELKGELVEARAARDTAAAEASL